MTDLARRLGVDERAQDRFRALFDHSPIGIALVDPHHGGWIDVNDATCRITGYSREELLARDFQSMTHPDDLDADLAQLTRLLAGEISDYRLTKRYRRRDGSDVWVLLSATLVRDDAGAPVYGLAQIVDIDAQVRGEQQRESDAERERAERAALEAIIALQQEVADLGGDRDTVLQLVTDRTFALLPRADGVAVELVQDDGDAERLVHRTGAGVLAPHVGLAVGLDSSLSGHAVRTRAAAWSDDTETDERVDRAACRLAGLRSMVVAPVVVDGSALGVLTIGCTRPDAFAVGERQMVMLLANCLSGALRQADDTAHIHRLLTSAREINAALRASEQRFRLAFTRSPLGVIVVDLAAADGRLRRVNPAMARITGYEVDELEGAPDGNFVEEADREGYRALLERVRSGVVDQDATTIGVRHRDGRRLTLRVHVGALHDEQEQVSGLVLIIEDITADMALHRDLEQRAHLLELARDAIIVRDTQGRIRYWNPGAERLYEWPAETVLGRDLDRLLDTRWSDGWTSASVREHLLAEASWEGELTHVRADGQRVTVLSRKALQRDEQGRPIGIMSINTDITARRRAEARLRASEALFRSQFEHSGVGQVIRSLDDCIESGNPALAAMLGVGSAAELVGRSMAEFAPEDPTLLGRPERADLVTGDCDSLGGESVLRRCDGGLLDVQYVISALRDDVGRPTKLVTVYQDISDRKAAERERDEAAETLRERNTELVRLNQLKTDLIGVMGHEIKNPLTVIMASTEIAEEDWRDASDEQRAFLDLVKRNTYRLERTVREALSMVTIEAGRLVARPVEVDLAERLAEAIADSGLSVPLEGAVGVSVRVQLEHLDQMVTNLLANAAKYGGGPAAVRVRQTPDGAEIAVIDRGPGVPEDFRDQLFHRFSRDESAAAHVKGTGLGLFIVRELAQANGGDVVFRPTPGGGATFTIFLPR